MKVWSVAVPTLAGVLLAMSAGAGEPTALQVVGGRAGVTDAGFLNIVGEVKNTSAQWVYKPRLRVDLFDAAGKPLASESVKTAVAEEQGMDPHEWVYTEHGYVAPGASAAFHFIRDVRKLKGTYGSHKLTVAAARTVPAGPRVEIEGLEIQKASDSEQRKISGRIKNLGPGGCISAQAVFAVYGADGKISKVEAERPAGSYGKALAAGQTLAFAGDLWPDDGFPVGTVKVTGDCEEE